MDALLATALAAAEAAAEIHLEHFGEVGLEGAQEKAHSDFVSEVDTAAQEAAMGLIRSRFPDHAILAEEDSAAGWGPTGRREWPEDGTPIWIIDPLDGTTNYLHGHPHFAASVAVGRLAELAPGPDRWDRAPGSQPSPILEAGAVVAPRTGERWWAFRGRGAWKNGRRVRVSKVATLKSALVGTGFPFKAPELVDRYLDQFRRVLPASSGVRRCGSAALDLCYLAEGILDAFWEEATLSPWDVAAGVLMVREAGGVAVRLDGGEIDLENGSMLAANSPDLLEALGRLVR
jgi:myo-inositol-1(or 4)-monophosphatase